MSLPTNIPEEQVSAFRRILNATATLSAQATQAVFALGTIALISTNTDVATLAPAFQVLVGGIGVNLLSDLIARVARGRADETEIQLAIQEALKNTELSFLESSEFQRELITVHRQLRHLHYRLYDLREEVLERLISLSEELRFIKQGIDDIQEEMREGFRGLSRSFEQIQYAAQVGASTFAYISELQHEIRDDADRQFESVRQSALEGKIESAKSWARELRENETRWEALTAEQRARALRFEASLQLNTDGDIELAAKLAQEARELSPGEGDIRLTALIAKFEQGYETAIAMLEGSDAVRDLNLRARLTLENGQPREAIRILSSIEDNEAEPDTYQIRALSYLALRSPDQAKLEIERALEKAAQWKHIRLAAATINYFSALATPAIPEYLVAWPEPSRWDFIKADAESTRSLEYALETFEVLIEEAVGTEQLRMQTWRLACLANHRDAAQETAELCESLIREHPGFSPVIRWAIHRSIEIDLGPSIASLQSRITGKTADLIDVDTLLKIYHSTGREQDGLELLLNTRSLFFENGSEDIWQATYAHSLAVNARYEEALTTLAGMADTQETRRTRATVMWLRAIDANDFDELATYLESSYRTIQHLDFLYEYCELMARLNNWGSVADLALELVKQIPTPSALTLASIALYNVGKYQECLNLIDVHIDLLSRRQLTTMLRQLRLACLHALGFHSDAVSEARQLANQEPSIINSRNLIQLYFETGDLVAATLEARRLNRRADLPAEVSLQLASIVRFVDIRFARSLWMQSVQTELPDAIVGDAYYLGHQLGFEGTHELLRSLMGRLRHLAARGSAGIQGFTIEEMREFILGRRRHEAQIIEQYSNGRAPVHIAQEALSIPLVNLYHQIPSRSPQAPDPLRQTALFFSHGSRSPLTSSPGSLSSFTLCLDITAVLLAAHLKILDNAEQSFASLYIPQSLIPALLAMRDRLEPVQPALSRAHSLILNLVDRGQIDVHTVRPVVVDDQGELHAEGREMIERLAESDGWFVCYEPTRRQVADQLSPELGSRVLNLRTVLEALRQWGPLSQNTYEQAIESLGEEAQMEVQQETPQPGDSLFFYGYSSTEIARLELLALLCRQYEIAIGENEVRHFRNEMQALEANEESAEWLDDLIGRLREGLDSGTYEMLPQRVTQTGVDVEIESADPAVDSLLTLITLPFQENRLIWIDDRFSNGHRNNASGQPIIGIVDVLGLLAAGGNIENDAYFRHLLQLRAANVRYIALEPEEIIYHLSQAEVDEFGRLIETAELEILRKHFAACLLQADFLQTSDQTRGQFRDGELNFLFTFNRAVVRALSLIWAVDEDTEAVRQARAGWILDNLFVDLGGLFQLTPFEARVQDNSYLLAGTLVHLISGALNLPFRIEHTSPASSYLEWLSFRVLTPRLEANPGLAEAAAELIKSTILETQRELLEDGEDGSLSRQVLILSIHGLLVSLPEPIQNAILQDQEFVESFGFVVGPTITVNDAQFRADDFWRAVSEALNGRSATIELLTEDVEATFQPRETKAEAPNIEINLSGEPAEIILRGEEFDILLETASEREHALRRRRYMLDCSQATLDQIILEIVPIRDPVRRMQALHRWEASSALLFYDRIHRQIREETSSNLSALLPLDIDGLLRHLRLNPENDQGEFVGLIHNAAEVLVREEGLQAAIERLASLPVPLPEPVIQAFVRQSPEDRRALVKRLLRVAASPVSAIHFIRLLLSIDGKEVSYHRLARRVTLNLLSERGKTNFDAYLAILTWTNEAFGRLPTFADSPSALRLVVTWLHAHRLFTILHAAGVPSDWITNRFRIASSSRFPQEVFERDPTYWFDVSHPRFVNWPIFLLTSFSYAIDLSAVPTIIKQLQDIVIPELTREVEGGPLLPTELLLWETRNSPNCLRSFLGSNIREQLQLILNSGTYDDTSLIPVGEVIKESLKEITSEEENWLAWYTLWSAREHLREQDLSEQYTAVLRGIDYLFLLRANPSTGILALHVASRHAANTYNESLAELLIDHLERFIEESHVEPPLEIENIQLMLVEVALDIGLAFGTKERAVQEFAKLMEQLSLILSSTPEIRHFIQRLCSELEVDQSGLFWRACQFLRAR